MSAEPDAPTPVDPGSAPPGELTPTPAGLGDRPNPAEQGRERAIFTELTVLWLVTLLLIRLVVVLHDSGVHEAILAAVPLLFIYAPVGLCHWRKVDSYAYRLFIPALGDTAAWVRALRDAAMVTVAITVPWLIGYHVYQSALFGHAPSARLPEDLALLVAYQIFFVAIPEEFFYRGYFQTRLNELFARKWLIFGVPMGWGAVIATAYFAFGHSVVDLQWWHFATFFPGLIFAWLRERTGGVIAGALFHAFCNVSVVILDTMYGLR